MRHLLDGRCRGGRAGGPCWAGLAGRACWPGLLGGLAGRACWAGLEMIRGKPAAPVHLRARPPGPTSPRRRPQRTTGTVTGTVTGTPRTVIATSQERLEPSSGHHNFAARCLFTPGAASVILRSRLARLVQARPRNRSDASGREAWPAVSQQAPGDAGDLLLLQASCIVPFRGPVQGGMLNRLRCPTGSPGLSALASIDLEGWSSPGQAGADLQFATRVHARRPDRCDVSRRRGSLRCLVASIDSKQRVWANRHRFVRDGCLGMAGQAAGGPPHSHDWLARSVEYAASAGGTAKTKAQARSVQLRVALRWPIKHSPCSTAATRCARRSRAAAWRLSIWPTTCALGARSR